MSVRLAIVLSCFAAATCGAPAARADFGIEQFDVTATASGGSTVEHHAGSHPYSLVTEIAFEAAGESPGQPGTPFGDGDLRDLRLAMPPGLIENPTAVVRCSAASFHAPRQSPFEASRSGESCPDRSQIGVVTLESSFGGGSTRTFGLFNLAPPPGAPSQIGFSPYGVPIAMTPSIRETGTEYGIDLSISDFPQRFSVRRLRIEAWGTPWSSAHDDRRGNCLNETAPEFGHSKCRVGTPTTDPRLAYLTLPTTCDAPMTTTVQATSWQHPDAVEATAAQSLEDCDSLLFEPRPAGVLGSARASSPSGFDFTIEGEGASLVHPGLRVGSQVKRAVIELPEGVTINPSLGAGLGYCSPGQYATETVASPPGAGCPNASKIGELTVESPLFDGPVEGGMFLAQPEDPTTAGDENPFGSLLAIYLVAKASDRGVMVKLPGEIAADPVDGSLVTTFDDLPQLPYFRFNVHFRETQRSPLATPSACGDATTVVTLSPWLHPSDSVRATTISRISSGIGGGPCPNGSLVPFEPGAVAGTLNRAAGIYSPFYLRMTRTDAEQEITSYSADLPPGLTAKLVGVSYCPEAAIDAAAASGGFAEVASPSCPASSRIGRTVAGYGLSSVLAYAEGGLYLAGPYHGQPLSIVAINPATVGPFDLGVIVVRSAIEVDRHSAQVGVDSSASDPIPHIRRGIPLHLRDLRVHIDRPGFTLNPTSCAHLGAASTLHGSGAGFSSSADDSTARVVSPFQVGGCAGLGFRPRFRFQLRGGARRGDSPSLRAEVRARPGDANIGSAAVTLPANLFLAQEQIDAVCTRPRFANGTCPAGSSYGRARAFSPLLSEPLEGRVYLRSNGEDRPLPDLVVALRGQVAIDLVGRIGGGPGGALRATFRDLPDAPISRFVLSMRGGPRGILQVGGDLCDDPRVDVRTIGKNNRGRLLAAKLGTRCRGR